MLEPCGEFFLRFGAVWFGLVGTNTKSLGPKCWDPCCAEQAELEVGREKGLLPLTKDSRKIV